MVSLAAFITIFTQMEAVIDRWYPDLTPQHKKEAEEVKQNIRNFFNKMGL